MQLSELSTKKLHFIGIGGAGMSGLARIALSHGAKVSGSDAKDSSVVTGLRALGAEIAIGHSASNIAQPDLVIFSSAIASTNPEMQRATELAIATMTRAQALALLMSGSRSIAVAGTHGKTTTTSMLTVALQTSGLDPSFAIGGTLTASGSNAHRGTGELFIAEADESDGSFIAYRPFGAIITNIEHDHVDFFATPDDVTAAFAAFIATIPSDGFLVYCFDDPGARALGASITSCRTISYGTGAGADLIVDQIELLPTASKARLVVNGKAIGEMALQVPGAHNVLNAAATVAICRALELPLPEFLTGLHAFRGAARRFELKGQVHGIRVIDDYGHHPTEISVTLDTARRFAGDGRVLTLFQPHRYSRTQAFTPDFAAALSKADYSVLLEIYSASEAPILGVSAANIVDQMKSAEFQPNFISATERIAELAQPGDVIVTLGAGDVSSLGSVIIDLLQQRFPNA
jgi:UDP-N-acetylmuramate--alanine ligase